ncbi:MAG: hypothetical protein Ct9H90mP5_04740 [Acidimicrobiaceae bacterium]|nr:MAG: hypothetical protein Ct9H90mP5_04740 [Acidimicrobiaceae bacterium]
MKKRLIFASVLAGLILTFGLGGNAMAAGESLGKCSVDDYVEKYGELGLTPEKSLKKKISMRSARSLTAV